MKASYPEKQRIALHPTRQKLVTTVAAMLDEMPVEQLRSSEVLQRSGTSRGSMYYHFENFNALVEEAVLHRYSAGVHASIQAIHAAIHLSRTREEMRELIHGVTRATQDPALAPRRLDRAFTLGLTRNNEVFREKLATVQGELTDAMTELFEQAQNKGLMSTNFHPRAAAVFVQAYTLGRVLDDVTDHHVVEADWDQLVNLFVDHVLIIDES